MGEISVKYLYPALCWAYVRGQTSQLAALTSCDAGCSGTTVIICWFHMIFILSSRICASASPVTRWHIATCIIMRNALWISLVDYLCETQVPKPTNCINIKLCNITDYYFFQQWKRLDNKCSCCHAQLHPRIAHYAIFKFVMLLCFTNLLQN